MRDTGEIRGQGGVCQALCGEGRDEAAIEWWSTTTYAALERGECLIEDPTLDELESRGVKTKPVEETVKEQLSS